jgi:micrococcal nuclease
MQRPDDKGKPAGMSIVLGPLAPLLPEAARRLALALLVLGALVLSSWPKAPYAAECHRVQRVYDGDTILVAGPQESYLVRLVGIDAPETGKGKGAEGQPYSQAARKYLADLVLNRCVDLVAFGTDRYDRRLALVRVADQDVNLAMVREGMAEVYRGRPPEGFDRRPLEAAQAEAQAARKGIWRQGEHYRSPMEWKHRPRP